MVQFARCPNFKHRTTKPLLAEIEGQVWMSHLSASCRLALAASIPRAWRHPRERWGPAEAEPARDQLVTRGPHLDAGRLVWAVDD